MHHFRPVLHPRGRRDVGRFEKMDFGVVIAVCLSVVSMFCGCEEKKTQRLTIQPNQDAAVADRAYPCSVLLVGDDGLENPLRRQWAARHDSEFELETISVDAFVAGDFEIGPGTDVVIYPSGMMIELIHRGRIIELSRSVYDSDAFNRRDLLTHFRKSGIRYDSKSWAIPCGSPLFAMIYQAQLATPETGLPQTWPQLIRWNQRLSETETQPDPEDRDRLISPAQGIGLPLAPGWAAKTFIAIAAPAVRQKGRLSVLFERRTMKPLVDTTGFVDALETMKVLADQHPASLNYIPADVWRELLAGKLAAGMTWPTAAGKSSDSTGDLQESSTGDADSDLLIADLPGSDTFYDVSAGAWGTRPPRDPAVVNFHGFSGLLASQVKQSRRAQSAAEFLKWLSDTAISQILFTDHPELGPTRITHLGDTKAWLGDQFSNDFESSYANHLKEAHQHALIMTLPNILKREQYLAVLDQAIREYLVSGGSAEAALQTVAQRWESLTESIGRKIQSNILRRNSNF